LLDETDAVTINTDLLAYASRDGGSTWDSITLSDEGDYDGDTRILVGECSLTSTGTDMCYKIESANNKNFALCATSLTWD
jgi:hypothetical protein